MQYKLLHANVRYKLHEFMFYIKHKKNHGINDFEKKMIENNIVHHWLQCRINSE